MRGVFGRGEEGGVANGVAWGILLGPRISVAAGGQVGWMGFGGVMAGRCGATYNPGMLRQLPSRSQEDRGRRRQARHSWLVGRGPRQSRHSRWVATLAFLAVISALLWAGGGQRKGRPAA